MHKRSFLVGLGIGIIVGALLLELFDLGAKSQQQLNQLEQQLNEPVSPSPAPDPEAAVTPDSTDLSSTAPEATSPDTAEPPEAPVAPEVSEAEQGGASSPVAPEVSEAEQGGASSPVAPEVSEAEQGGASSPVAPEVSEAEQGGVSSPVVPSVEDVDAPKASYILRVYPGDSVTKTGKQLAEHGIIADADEFVTYYKQHDATIRAGFFLLEEQSSFDDLRQLFASQPLTEAEAKGQVVAKGITLID